MGSSPLTNLLSRLEGVREVRAGKFYAKCPAHDDKSPSLSVRDTDDTILIHCFAGCSPDDVLAAIGLSFSDLYADRWKAAEQAAYAAAGHEASKRVKFDPEDHERLILEIAENQMKAGEALSLEDKARIQLALDRLGYKRAAS